MSGERDSQKFQYDAFISYRHRPLDEAVASRVQNLLERYRPPKNLNLGENTQIKRIFRDTTELPTSGDLEQSLQDALLNSRYLIVILSKELQLSKWCMEEIRCFKEAHGGKINHILPILVSGEPSESIPEILMHETHTISLPDGTVVSEEVDVEPLCCDVRADSVRKSLRKLNTEFLRIAAPLLGCGFDDLYQRHMRRRRQTRRIAAASVFSLLTAVLGVISVFAYRTYVAQQRYYNNLVDTYTRQGAEQLLQGENQEALMYYGSALNLDHSKQAARTGALLLLQTMDWLNEVEDIDEGELERLLAERSPNNMLLTREKWKELGEYFGQSDSGNTYFFSKDGKINAFFTDTGKVVNVPYPSKINEKCDAQSVEIFQDDPATIALYDGMHLAVAYGGYLYLYDLNTGDEGQLIIEFDLAYLFPKDAQNNNLRPWTELWADEDGTTVVIANGSSAAVLNGRGKYLSAVHTNYGCSLNDVAFCSDDGRYALVYGNDMGISLYNPGGHVEVYDSEGNVCMETEESMDVAPKSAAFSPDGKQLLVWGSATLQIWNLDSQRMAAPLQTQQIADAGWLEDGRILVDEGDGNLQLYEQVRFAPPERDFSDVEIPEAWNSRTVRQIELEDGTVLAHSYSSVRLEDGEGNVLEKESCLVNRMYADAEAGVGYFWYQGANILYRSRPDGVSMNLELLDTRGWGITEVYPAGNGVTAVTGNGYLLYYDMEDVSPTETLLLGQQGIVRTMAADDSGLLAVVIQTTSYADRESNHFENTYGVELWDLNMGVRLANLEEKSSVEPKQPVFTDDGWLVYWKRENAVGWLVDAAEPDSAAIAQLQQLSCFTLDESQAVQLKRVQVNREDLGNWKDILKTSTIMPVDSGDTEKTKVQQWMEELKTVLETEGADAWLALYDRRWMEMTDGSASLSDMDAMFRDYIWTAFQNGKKDDLRVGVTCFRDAVLKENDLTYISFDTLLGQYMLLSDAYDDLMIEYWLTKADQIEQGIGYDSEEWFDQVSFAYTLRAEAGLLKGRGEQAFIDALDGLDEKFLEILITDTIKPYYLLVQDKPEEAAEVENDVFNLLIQYGEDEEEMEQFVWLCLMEAILYRQRGVITEECFNRFIDGLSVKAGLELTQLSKENMEAGLQVGDLVLQVNDVRICTRYELFELMERYPTAVLTVQRENKVLTTKPVGNWKLSGVFTIY